MCALVSEDGQARGMTISQLIKDDADHNPESDNWDFKTHRAKSGGPMLPRTVPGMGEGRPVARSVSVDETNVNV